MRSRALGRCCTEHNADKFSRERISVATVYAMMADDVDGFDGRFINNNTTSKQVVFLMNFFFIGKKRHKVTIHVDLNSSSSKSTSSITWEPDKSKKRKTVFLTDVIGIELCNKNNNITSKSKKFSSSEELPLHTCTCFQLHYAERKDSSSRLWVPKSIILKHSQAAVIQQWIIAVQSILKEQDRPQRLLVFINPYGGKRKAVNIYDNHVKPLFQLAGIDTHDVVTTHANHALEFIQEVDVSRFDGLIAVGGDGMYCEVMTGLLLKTQKENKVNIKEPWNDLVRPSLRIGIIPAGSTDAVVYCTTGTHDPITSTINIILGSRTNIDVCSVHSNGKEAAEQKFLRFSTCMMAYGYFGDTLQDSERHRWMGPARYDWSGFKSFLLGKTYDGTVKLKKDTSQINLDPRKRAKCRVGCEHCQHAFTKNVAKEASKNSNNSYPPGFNDTFDYETVTGKFWAINAATMTCKCGRTKQGISPEAHLGDGYTDVVIVHKTSRLNYLRYLIRTAFQTKSPFDLDFVSVHRVKMFSFIPYGIIDNNTLTRTSLWNCDGEIIRESSVSVRVHCQLISLFARGIYEKHQEPSCCLRLCNKKTVPSEAYMPSGTS